MHPFTHSMSQFSLVVARDGVDSEETAEPGEVEPGPVESEPLSSYDITLVNDPIMEVENYDIGDLSSDASTDDEDCPKKVGH